MKIFFPLFVLICFFYSNFDINISIKRTLWFVFRRLIVYQGQYIAMEYLIDYSVLCCIGSMRCIECYIHFTCSVSSYQRTFVKVVTFYNNMPDWVSRSYFFPSKLSRDNCFKLKRKEKKHLCIQ